LKDRLPETANSQHLKKQAKRLLKDCHAAVPHAIKRMVQLHPHYTKGVPQPDQVKLQEAQHVVAREYGISSWPTLMQMFRTDAAHRTQEASDLLIYTNGQSAIRLMEEAGVPGEVREWSDTLIDGPVPLTDTQAAFTAMRCKHLSSLGFAGYDNIRSRFSSQEAPLLSPERYSQLQLWFEQDLFDQLLLTQLLCRLDALPEWREKTVLFQYDSYIGHHSPQDLLTRQPEPIRLAQPHFQEATRFWTAFRQAEPTQIAACLDEEFLALPYLSPCLKRLCEEFPSLENGMSRTEQQILDGIFQEQVTPGTLFRFSQQQEDAMFLGDASFFLRVEAMMLGPSPLIELEGGGPFLTPSLDGYTEAFRTQRFRLTPVGNQVRTGIENGLRHRKDGYWVGGTWIDPERAFCWDRSANAFQHVSM